MTMASQAGGPQKFRFQALSGLSNSVTSLPTTVPTPEKPNNCSFLSTGLPKTESTYYDRFAISPRLARANRSPLSIRRLGGNDATEEVSSQLSPATAALDVSNRSNGNSRNPTPVVIPSIFQENLERKLNSVAGKKTSPLVVKKALPTVAHSGATLVGRMSDHEPSSSSEPVKFKSLVNSPLFERKQVGNAMNGRTSDQESYCVGDNLRLKSLVKSPLVQRKRTVSNNISLGRLSDQEPSTSADSFSLKSISDSPLLERKGVFSNKSFAHEPFKLNTLDKLRMQTHKPVIYGADIPSANSSASPNLSLERNKTPVAKTLTNDRAKKMDGRNDDDRLCFQQTSFAKPEPTSENIYSSKVAPPLCRSTVFASQKPPLPPIVADTKQQVSGTNVEHATGAKSFAAPRKFTPPFLGPGPMGTFSGAASDISNDSVIGSDFASLRGSYRAPGHHHQAEDTASLVEFGDGRVQRDFPSSDAAEDDSGVESEFLPENVDQNDCFKE